MYIRLPVIMYIGICFSTVLLVLRGEAEAGLVPNETTPTLVSPKAATASFQYRGRSAIGIACHVAQVLNVDAKFCTYIHRRIGM